MNPLIVKIVCDIYLKIWSLSPFSFSKKKEGGRGRKRNAFPLTSQPHFSNVSIFSAIHFHCSDLVFDLWAFWIKWHNLCFFWHFPERFSSCIINQILLLPMGIKEFFNDLISMVPLGDRRVLHLPSGETVARQNCWKQYWAVKDNAQLQEK